MTFGARALIRLGALKHNLGVIRDAAPKAKVMAVIKANAYGHGMLTVAGSLADVDAFAVARLPEAVRLRESGTDRPIILLAGVLTDQELRDAVKHGFELVVHCPEQLELLEKNSDGRMTIWLKVDTGMNRLGFRPEDAAGVIERLRACENVGELRLMTHLASADVPDDPATGVQLERFRSLLQDFRGAVSFANSPATLGGTQTTGALITPEHAGEIWIRPGIALFGISPFADRTAAELGLKPVMQFEARLIATKRLDKGTRVGYRGRFESDADSILGIIAAGYGDGYTRHFRDGTPILINGRRVPLIGNVSMDLIAVDLGRDATDRVGDIATLWGDDLPVEEVAPWADAIPYELVCGVMNREASEVVD